MIDQTNHKGFLSMEHHHKTPSIQPIKERLTQNNTKWFNKISKKLSMSFLKHHGQMISQFQITPWKQMVISLNSNSPSSVSCLHCMISPSSSVSNEFKFTWILQNPVLNITVRNLFLISELLYLDSVGRSFLANTFEFEDSGSFRVDVLGSVVKFKAINFCSWCTHALSY